MNSHDVATTVTDRAEVEGLWTEDHTAKHLGLSLFHLRRLRASGDGPPNIRLPGGRWGLIRYDPAEVRAWTRRFAESRGTH
jgi:hypothetical protein